MLRAAKMVYFEFATGYGHQIFRKSAKSIILSVVLKLGEKSGLNFMKTRFDWERLGFATHRIFSYVRSNF